MILFWILAALLTAGALCFVLPPLLRRTNREAVAIQLLNIAVFRDQLLELDADRRSGTLSEAQYERARLELERRLLEDVSGEGSAQAPTAGSITASISGNIARPSDASSESTGTPIPPPVNRLPAVLAAVIVPVLAVGLYFAVGMPRALISVAVPTDAKQGVTPAQIEAMVAKLAERMRANPEDPQGWAMLAKSYGVLGRFEDAAGAYSKALERAPNNPDWLADYADLLGLARGQSLEGEPAALVMRALKIDPNHVKALALAGTVAFDRKDYPNAIMYWERMAAQLPPDSETARGVQASISEARGLAGASGGKTADKVVTAQGAASGVTGIVTLAPQLAVKAAPDATVFIFARAVDGARMPLAIIRKKVSDLPLSFTLDDSLAMSPATRLSGAPKVIIGARISKSGEALPQAGDLEGFSAVVGNTDKAVAVLIDREVVIKSPP